MEKEFVVVTNVSQVTNDEVRGSPQLPSDGFVLRKAT